MKQRLVLILLSIIIIFALIQFYNIHSTNSRLNSPEVKQLRKNFSRQYYQYYQHHFYYDRHNPQYDIRPPVQSPQEQKENDKELRRLLEIRKRIRLANDTSSNVLTNDDDIFSFPEDLEQRVEPDTDSKKWKKKIRRDGKGNRVWLPPPDLSTISSCFHHDDDEDAISKKKRKPAQQNNNNTNSYNNSKKRLKFPLAKSQSIFKKLPKSTRRSGGGKTPRFAIITLHSHKSASQKSFAHFINPEEYNPKPIFISDNTTHREIMKDLSFLNKLQYCRYHGIDLIVESDSIVDQNRSPHWAKLRAIRLHIDRYDWIMWVDADAFFFNFTYKIEHFVDSQVLRYKLKDLKEQELLARRFNSDVKIRNEEDVYNLLASEKGGAYRRKDVDLILTRDWQGEGLAGINTGVMLMRNSNWTKDFLRELWSVPPADAAPFNDQGAFRKLLVFSGSEKKEKREERKQHVYLMKDNIMNAYPSELIVWGARLGFSFDESRGWIVHFAHCRAHAHCIDWMHYYYRRAACEHPQNNEDWLFLYDPEDLHRERAPSAPTAISGKLLSSFDENEKEKEKNNHHPLFSSPDVYFPPEYSEKYNETVRADLDGKIEKINALFSHPQSYSTRQLEIDRREYENIINDHESRGFILSRLLPPFDEFYKYTPVPPTTTRDARTVHPSVLRDQERRRKMMQELDRKNEELFAMMKAKKNKKN